MWKTDAKVEDHQVDRDNHLLPRPSFIFISPILFRASNSLSLSIYVRVAEYTVIEEKMAQLC